MPRIYLHNNNHNEAATVAAGSPGHFPSRFLSISVRQSPISCIIIGIEWASFNWDAFDVLTYYPLPSSRHSFPSSLHRHLFPLLHPFPRCQVGLDPQTYSLCDSHSVSLNIIDSGCEFVTRDRTELPLCTYLETVCSKIN